MKLHSRFGWLICTLLWALLTTHVPEQPGMNHAETTLQSASCDHGQGCILVRDVARPWLADLQNRPVRHLEYNEQSSLAGRLARFRTHTGVLLSSQPRTEARVPTLAEETLALLYPYHELG